GINNGLDRLRGFGLTGADLVPLPRVAGREPPVRFVLENGDSKRVLAQLRELVAEIRKLGERGLSVTRFKGRGGVDPDALWGTRRGQGEADEGADGGRGEGGRDVPHADGREGRAAPRLHPEARPGGQGDRLPRGVIWWGTQGLQFGT